MSVTTDLFDQALLAEAAYAKLTLAIGDQHVGWGEWIL